MRSRISRPAPYYEARQPGIGDELRDSLLTDIEKLELTAGLHAERFGCHRMIATRFPYAVFYRMRRDTVNVIAVLPMRLDPKWIESQLRSR